MRVTGFVRPGSRFTKIAVARAVELLPAFQPAPLVGGQESRQVECESRVTGFHGQANPFPGKFGRDAVVGDQPLEDRVANIRLGLADRPQVLHFRHQPIGLPCADPCPRVVATSAPCREGHGHARAGPATFRVRPVTSARPCADHRRRPNPDERPGMSPFLPAACEPCGVGNPRTASRDIRGSLPGRRRMLQTFYGRPCGLPATHR